MISVSFREHGRPVEVLRWSPTKWRKAEAIRDRVMRGAGTQEPWISGNVEKNEAIMRADYGRPAISGQWRKPLRADEVARMAPTSEVRERKGRA